MSASWFDDLGFSLFSLWPDPPDVIPLRLLGLTERTTREAINEAFTRQVKANHPDVVAEGRLTMDELVWARKVLLIKTPAPVTGVEVSRGEFFSRYEDEPDKPCKGGCGKVEFRGHYRGRWRGYCYACSRQTQNAEKREKHRRARADRACENERCGAVFTPSRSDGRYCKPACRQAAHRARAAS